MSQGDEKNAPVLDGRTGSGGTPVESGLLKNLLLLFCCWHAVFLLISIKPPPPGKSEAGNPIMDLYRLLLGGRQTWDVFKTIPVFRSMDLRLEHEDENGAKVTAGCVLPGFQPYPKPEDSRYYQLFWRLALNAGDVAFQEAYLRNAARLLSARQNPGAGGKWSLVVDLEYTRSLAHSRRDGQLALPHTQTLVLPSPGGNSP